MLASRRHNDRARHFGGALAVLLSVAVLAAGLIAPAVAAAAPAPPQPAPSPTAPPGSSGLAPAGASSLPLPPDAPTTSKDATPPAPSPALDEPLARPSTVVLPTDPANPVAVALAQAQRTGKRVQVTAKDTETTTTWANPDGTMTTDLAAGPVRVRQGSGFVPVDPTLVVQSGGTVVPKATPANVRFSGGGALADLASVGSPGSRLGLRWPSALPAPTLAGDTATYHDVVPGGDLVVKALTTGYEVSLVLRARPTAATVIRLPLALDGLSVAQEATGRLRLTDAAGKEVASSAPPVMTSAARDPRADEPTQISVIPTTVETVAGVAQLVLRPDPGFLSDPATVYPVTIDPDGTLGTSLSNYVASDYPNQNYDGDPLLKVGTYNGGATVDRSFIRFDDGLIKGMQVTGAVLNLYETWAYSCTDEPMWVDGAGVFGAGTTWNTQPWVDHSHWYSGSFSGGYSACPGTAGWKGLNITGLVQAWQPGGAPQDALALLAPNESDSYQWKKFASVNSTTAPYIAVTYTAPGVPSAPQNVSAVAGNAQATVSWSPPAYAPGLDGYGVFNYLWNGSTWVNVSGAGVGLATSTTLTGLVNGGSYVVYVYSHNNVGWGGYGYAFYTPAAPPTIPLNIVAGGGNASATARWVAPASNGGVPEDFYLVAAYDTVGPTLYNYFTVCGTCTWTPYPNLPNGRGWQIAVWGHNGPGGYGPPVVSNVVSTATSDPMAGAGEQSFFTYDTYALSGRTTAKVNVGTGNLEVATTDLVVPTAGGSLALGHTFNSMAFVAGASTDYSGQFGYGWASNQTPDVRLVVNPDPGRVELVSSSGGNQVFVGTAGAASTAYTAPPAADATLVRNSSDGTYTLTGHATAAVLRFRDDGQLLSDTDRNNNALTFSYGDGRRPGTITGTAGAAPGNTVTYTYNGPNGLVSSMAQTADGATRTVSFAYNANQEISQVTDAAGGVTTFAYGANSSLAQITGPAPLSAVTKFTYDNVARVTSVTRVVGSANTTTTYDYSLAGHTKVTDADGHPPVDYTLDATGRVTTATDAKGKATSTTYTADAKVGSVLNASQGTTTNTFGANSGESLTQSQSPTGATVTATYNAPGQPYLPDSVNDTMGKATTFTYSGPGNLASSANALAATASLTYNADGTVATATDPGGAVTNYTYNGAHQLVTVTPPAPLGAQSFTYDGAGRTRTATSAGMTTTYTYDALDRITGETHSDSTPTLSYAYDANGNLTSRTDASGTTAFAYDAANHLTSKTLPGGAVLGYTYDAAGNLITSSDAGGTTTYHYDKANLVDQITEPGGRTDVFAYDADHRRTDTWDATGGPVAYDASGNNVVPPATFAVHIHASFNNAGQLTGLKTTRASSDANANRVSDLSYSYTVPGGTTCAGATAGRVTALRQSVIDNLAAKTTAYCYDGGGRLLSATTGGGPTYTYAYDANGNRTSGPEGTHTFNSANEATDASSAYDATGNLTASTAFPAAAYNKLNQATSITASGQSALAMAYAGTTNTERTAAGATTYQNGLLGVQTQATTTCTLGLLCSTVTSGFVRDPQGGLIAEKIGTDEYYYAFDGIGSVVALIDATGTQRASYSYDPYGGHATATALNGALPDNPWRYAGGALDSTGLYHFGARYYDPTIGRWTQQDSIVSLGDPRNGNRYAYAGDDPANFVDPTGESFLSKLKCAAGELDPFSFSEGSLVGGGAAIGSAGVEAGKQGAKFAIEAAKLGIEASDGAVAAAASGGLIVVGAAVAAYGGYRVYKACKHA